MEQIVRKFKRESLATFQQIKRPGKYVLVSNTNVTDKNLFTDDKGISHYICGFKAVSADKLPQVFEVFKDREEVDLVETNGLFMTANIWVNPGQKVELPMRGEQVDCSVDFVASRDSGLVLRITGVRVRSAETAEMIDLKTFFNETETISEDGEVLVTSK